MNSAATSLGCTASGGHGLRHEFGPRQKFEEIGITTRAAQMRFTEKILHLVRNDLPGTKRLTEFFVSKGLSVAAFRTAAQYIASGRDERPTCLVLDLLLPDINGIEMQRSLAGSGAPPVIFVTAHGDPASVASAMRNGAIDFLVEPVDYVQLMAAVEFAFAADLKNRIDRIESTALLARWKSLTPREREVFHHTVAGLLNKQAAAELGVAENTYQVHRGRVMRKMKADSLADLVRMAAKLEPFVESPSQEKDAVPRPRWTLEVPTTTESTHAYAHRLSVTGKSRSASAWAEL
jgi:FixJ family two-component response regulator